MAQSQGHGCELYGGGAEVKFEIANIQEFPPLKPTVANRMWKAWWEPAGNNFQTVLDHIEEIPAKRGIPFGLVAHDNGTYIGSVLGIASDLEVRPALTPWVAALWVDSDYRKQGVANALMKAALVEIFALGPACAYLCATAEKRAHYLRFGWRFIEQGVGGDALDVFEISKIQNL